MSSRSSTPRMWFSARPVSTIGSSSAVAASAASATRSAATSTSSIASGGRVVVLDRAAGGAGLGEQGDRLGHAARVVGVQRSLSTFSGSGVAAATASTCATSSSRVTFWSCLPSAQANPALVVASASKPQRRQQLGRADVPRVRHHKELSPAWSSRNRARRSLICADYSEMAQALDVARVVGEDLDPVVGDDDGVGVAEAAEPLLVDAGLDREDHPGLDRRVVADVEERRLVVAQTDRRDPVCWRQSGSRSLASK